jgi:catechol 2,3-dioxygenase-like lactoylglutathione lyase family enzyme
MRKRINWIVVALQPWLKKSFWIGLGLAVVLTWTQQDLVLAQRSQFQLHHVTLSVKDVDRVSKWYADMLGFTIGDRFTLTRPDGKQIQVVRIAMPGLKMNISQFDGSVTPNRSGERQGWRHVAFQVNSVDRSYQGLRAKGVKFFGEPFTYNPPGYRIAFFQDPEGNILELYQEL